MAASSAKSGFSQDAQTARQFGAEFNEIQAGVVALTTLQTVATVAHGLSTTPDWAQATVVGGAAGVSSYAVVEFTSATTITLSTGNTTGSKSIAWQAGDLA